MSADGKPVVVLFRATNIFRLENGEWKMRNLFCPIHNPQFLPYSLSSNNRISRTCSEENPSSRR